jgi:Ca2+-binding EF-hand superfamily protein
MIMNMRTNIIPTKMVQQRFWLGSAKGSQFFRVKNDNEIICHIFTKGLNMLKTVIITSALLLSSAAMAQQAMPGPDDIISRMDANKDGFIGKDEAQGRIAENFDVIDTDKDSKITLDELKARAAARREAGAGEERPRPAGGMPSPEEIMGFLDTNQDGFIVKDEAQGPLAQYFDMVDADKDVKISLEELKTAMAAMRPPEE